MLPEAFKKITIIAMTSNQNVPIRIPQFTILIVIFITQFQSIPISKAAEGQSNGWNRNGYAVYL